MAIKIKHGTAALTAGLTFLSTLAVLPAQAEVKADEGRTHTYYFSMAGERRTFEEDGVTGVEVVVPNDKSEGRYNVITAEWLATFQVPAHYHKTHSETFYVMDGQVEWTVGGETRVLKKGDAVFIPPNTVHAVKVIGGKPMSSLMIYEPGGYEDQADFKMNYTEEELKDPKIQQRVRAMGDFNLAE